MWAISTVTARKQTSTSLSMEPGAMWLHPHSRTMAQGPPSIVNLWRSLILSVAMQVSVIRDWSRQKRHFLSYQVFTLKYKQTTPLKLHGFSSSSSFNEKRVCFCGVSNFPYFHWGQKMQQHTCGGNPQSNVSSVSAVVGMTTNKHIQPLAHREVSQIIFIGHPQLLWHM